MRTPTMLKRSLVHLAAGVLAAGTLVPAAGRAQPGGGQVTSTFTKQAVAVRPGGATPVPGQVAVGQRIDYVLSAMAQGPGGVPASGIVDVLSPNQTYVPGSLQMPPGWTVTPSPPYALPSNQAMYAAPAGASLLSFQLPVGGGTGSLVPSPGGDGMYPIPGAANGNVYAVFHHKFQHGTIDCWKATSLVRCAGFPKSTSANDDLVTLYNFNGVVVQQRFIYYAAVQRTSTTTTGGRAGFACWDTAVDQPCAFQPAGNPAIPATPDSAIAGSELAGVLLIPGTSKVLIAVKNSLYCYDMSSGPGTGVPCSGWTAAGVATASGPHPSANLQFLMDIVFELGPNPTRIFVSVGGGSDRVQCVTITTPYCGGWTMPQSADNPWPSPSFDLHPIPTWSGTTGAVCLYTLDGSMLRLSSTNPAPACWSSTGSPVNLTALGISPYSPISSVSMTSMALGSAAGTNRVIFARWAKPPLCVEMTMGTLPTLPPNMNPGPCPGAWTTLPSIHRDYGFAPDPLAPSRCVLTLGDAGQLYRFDGLTGKLGCPVTYQTTGDPMDFFCQKQPTQLDWSRIVIRNRPPQLTGGTILVRNATTGAVLQTIPVTGANSYSIASIPYASNHTLTIEFTPTYPPNAAVGPYSLEVQFTANEAPQICYQARVVRCGPITNTATFGPHPDSAAPAVIPHAPWTRTAAVDLGRALSGPCDPCVNSSGDSLDLSIRKRALFPPWIVGSQGDFQIITTVEQGTFNSFTAATPTFVDNLPAGLTYHTFSGTGWTCSAVGAQVSCTYSGPVVPAGQQLPPVIITVNVVGPAGVLRNCAVLGPDANPDNNRSCDEVRIGPCEVDLAIRKAALEAPWTVGGTGVFQIRVGVIRGTLDPAAVSTPTFTDVLPAGVTFQSAGPNPPWNCTAAGQLVSCKYTGLPVAAPNALPPAIIRVNVVGPAGGIVNCAVLGTDETLANNRSCVEVPIHEGHSTHGDSLDLAIEKGVVQPLAVVGAIGAFEIRTQVMAGTFNPAGAPTPTFVDVLPAGLVFQSYGPTTNWQCSVSGQQVSCTYVGTQTFTAPASLPAVTIVVRAVAEGQITNCARLGPDANLANNRSCVGLTIGSAHPQPDTLDLMIRKRALPAPWTVGGTGTFVIRTSVINGALDPSSAATPTFVDVLPAGVTFVSYSGQPDWSCSVAGPQVSCKYLGPVAYPPTTLTAVTITVNVVGPAGVIVNCAVLSPDADLGNNRGCVEVAISKKDSTSHTGGPGKGFTLGAWGGTVFPTSTFADSARAGFGLGATVGVRVTPGVEVYGGYSSSSFGSTGQSFGSAVEGRTQAWARGFEGGVRALFPAGAASPFLQAGLVYHTVTVERAGVGRRSDRVLGYQAGGGLELALARAFSIAPRLLYTLRPGEGSRGSASDLRADAGVRVRLP